MKTNKTTVVNEIIIHAGMHKTASTSIQICLSDPKNQNLLAEKKYLYPQKWPQNHSAAINSIFRHDPENFHVHKKANRNKSQINKINDRYLHDIKTEVALTTPRKLILSGEGISILPLESLQQFKEFLDSTFQPTIIRVIIYVRNPVFLKISKIQQVIGGSSRTYKTALQINFDRKNDSMSQQIKDLTTTFGKEFVDVYSFEEAIRHARGPVGHFLSKIGYDNDESIKFQITKSNESLSQLAANIISSINERHPFFINGTLNPKRYQNDVLPIKQIKGPKFDLSWEQKQELQNTFNDEIIWLKSHYNIDYGHKIERKVADQNNRITNKQLSEINVVYTEVSDFIQTQIIEYLKNLPGSDIENSYTNFQAFIMELEKPIKLQEKLKRFYSSTKHKIKHKIKQVLSMI